ncbi:aldehyde dehydrogenase family protein [Salibacterium salarium]|uniref:Aldehyde dehydrogenase family protein n=1 Tax=Salibacterium salarium TaxID=284579 RepID=A0A3R9QN97_9BACI|nr:aldehyde dehydrogenase family protein [Salibacterium salarium]RSL34035.1 aldehyde dehydrogenase family protein [Salibacterium salarium]
MPLEKVNVPIYENLIGGEWVEGDGLVPVQNKYNGETLSYITKASKEIVHEAVNNALMTYQEKKLTVDKRYNILMKAAHIFEERKEELALTIVHEAGKVLKDARGEIDRGIQTFIASAEEAKRITGTGIPIQGQPGQEGKIAFTVRVPVGVVGAITPFNFPFNLTAHKVAPAIAAGNTVVLKPAEATPIIHMKLVEILLEAGLPGGFLNVVNGIGRETGQYLLEDERIALFSFTGSAPVGRHIKRTTGIRRLTLELGNNSPNIVHKDVQNIKRAAHLCVTKGYGNAGQACISVQRIYVHRDVYDEFLKEAIKVVEKTKVGDPELADTDVGPMISEEAAASTESWVKEAVHAGATIAFGGKRDGAVFYPTILTDVTEDMKVVCEEVFAPIVSIIAYDDINNAFAKANYSKFGLQTGLFTSNINLAMQAAQELEFGGVIINNVSTYRADIMPYGGVKDSGIGKEGPKYAVQDMTEEKVIVIDTLEEDNK